MYSYPDPSETKGVAFVGSVRHRMKLWLTRSTPAAHKEIVLKSLSDGVLKDLELTGSFKAHCFAQQSISACWAWTNCSGLGSCYGTKPEESSAVAVPHWYDSGWFFFSQIALPLLEGFQGSDIRAAIIYVFAMTLVSVLTLGPFIQLIYQTRVFDSVKPEFQNCPFPRASVCEAVECAFGSFYSMDGLD